MKTAITVEKLSVYYGPRKVIKGISFDVGSGEFFAIVGPNASGKTTLVKALCGILKNCKGTITVLGRPIEDYSRRELAKMVAIVPQNLPENLPFSVEEVVLMGRSPHVGLLGWECKHDWHLAYQAMRFANVEHLASHRVNELSGGERQRVFIAKALCQEPKLLLLDEPTASLDLAHQVRIMDLLERMRNEMKITIVMVSHDLNLSAMYADRILLIADGEIVKVGSPAEVFTSSLLQEVFRCKLLVDENPLGKVPRVTLIPWRFTQEGRG